MEDEPPAFANVDEEMKYWKEQAQNYKQKAQDTQDEFDEYQESSRALESELEAQLEQLEKQNSDLQMTKLRLEQEVENLKEKLDTLNHENFITISTLQEEASTLMQHRETLQKYVRELEQTNDDLERAKRNTVQSLDDFESRLNQEMERNALLEHELDEKETLHAMVQRLKDETRDLRHELAVRPKVIIREVTPSSSMLNVEEIGRDSIGPSAVPSVNVSSASSLNSIRGCEEVSTNATNGLVATAAPAADSTRLTPAAASEKRPAGRKGMTNVQNTPLPSTTRLSALTIVSDLLRKVGLLESKLANARSIQTQSASPITIVSSSELSSRIKPGSLPNGTVEALKG